MESGEGSERRGSFNYLRELEFRRLPQASIQSVFTGENQPNAEIIVVDNASTQDGIEGIAAIDQRIRVFAEHKNLGFAGANNLGASRAHGEILLFLNPDTEVSPARLTGWPPLEMLPDAGILGARLLNANGSFS